MNTDKLELNTITIRRRRISGIEAPFVWEQHFRGRDQHFIAHRLGINPGRVNEVIKKRLFPKAREQAWKDFRGPDLFDA